ncbi:hypothetical protein H671_5g13563 [Cricetulus griseus]|nr:hypothetical protein H671_5g13563 [Cricetulus griseus]
MASSVHSSNSSPLDPVLALSSHGILKSFTNLQFHTLTMFSYYEWQSWARPFVNPAENSGDKAVVDRPTKSPEAQRRTKSFVLFL